MAYNDQSILRDKDGKPIPQVWDPDLNVYVPLTADMLQDVPSGGASASGYGIIKNGDSLIPASQGNDVLEIIGEGIGIEIIPKGLTIGDIQTAYNRVKLTKSPTSWTEITDKQFDSLNEDFLITDGVVSINRDRVSGGSGGGMPFLNINNFKLFDGPNDITGTTYGAPGDKFKSPGLDTQAFQIAANQALLKGSVNIYIPDGQYILNDTIQLYPNTNIEMSRNAVIRKTHDKPMFSNFIPTGIYKGYNGRGKIFWKGGTLDCKDASGVRDPVTDIPPGVAREGSTFSFVNAEYFEFKNIIFLDNKNTHHFDLSGIRNIVISECFFYGYTYNTVDSSGVAVPQAKIRAYSECIQLDYSAQQAMPTLLGGWDGTACQFVFIQKCKFDKSDRYPSWNRSIGMHNVYLPTYNWICKTDGTLTGNDFNFEYSKAKNIYLTDNEIYGNGTIRHDYYGVDKDGISRYDPEDFIIQQIRLLNVDNVYVSGNKFENCKGGVAFDTDQSSKTMTDTDSQRDFSTSNTGHHLPYSVEWIDARGDRQIILYSESTADRGTRVTTYRHTKAVHGYDRTYTITWSKHEDTKDGKTTAVKPKILDYYGISNCHIINNTFKNITAGVYDTDGSVKQQPSTPIFVRGECRTKASSTTQGTRGNKVIIMGNIIDGVVCVSARKQMEAAAALGLTVAAPGTTLPSGSDIFTANIVSAISVTWTRNSIISNNEIRNCARAVYLSGCNRGLIVNNQIFTTVDTEAICIVGGGIYLVANNIMDNLFDSAIRMKGTDQFFVEGNIITNTNKAATWTISFPFYQHVTRSKPVIWVEVDGSGGSKYGTVCDNKIYTALTSGGYIEYPIKIENTNTMVKSSGNIYIKGEDSNGVRSDFIKTANIDLNLSDCGEDTKFKGLDADTLDGNSMAYLKASVFLERNLLGAKLEPNGGGIPTLDKNGKIDVGFMPDIGSGIKTIKIPNPTDATKWVDLTPTALASWIYFKGSNGISILQGEGNTIEIKFDANGSWNTAINTTATNAASSAITNHADSETGLTQHFSNGQKLLVEQHMDLDTEGEHGEPNHFTGTQKTTVMEHVGEAGNDKHFDTDQKQAVKDHMDVDTADEHGEPLHFSDGQKRLVEQHMGLDTDGQNGEPLHFSDGQKDALEEHMMLTEDHPETGAALHLTDVQIQKITDAITANNAEEAFLRKKNLPEGQTTPKQIVEPEVEFMKNTQLKRYEEKVGTVTNVGTVLTCDLSTGTIFNIPVPPTIAKVDIVFINTPTNLEYSHSVVVYVATGTTVKGVSVPTNVRWHNAIAPVFQVNKTTEMVFRTTGLRTVANDPNSIIWFGTSGGIFANA